LRCVLNYYCSEVLFSSDHCLDTVVHILDKLNFVSSESSSVGDIEDTIVGLGVLTMDTSDLDKVLVSDFLVKSWVLHQLWKVDMDGGSESGTHVGWAGGNVTKMLIVGELCLLFDLGRSIRESLEDLKDVGSLLHGDDSS